MEDLDYVRGKDEQIRLGSNTRRRSNNQGFRGTQGRITEEERQRNIESRRARGYSSESITGRDERAYAERVHDYDSNGIVILISICRVNLQMDIAF